MSAQVEEKVKQGGAIAGLGKNCSHHHRSWLKRFGSTSVFFNNSAIVLKPI